MTNRHLYRDEGPRLGGGLVLSFLTIVAATILAFIVFDREFTGTAQAARMYVPRGPVVSVEAEQKPSVIGRLIAPEAYAQSPATAPNGIDEVQTASVEAEAAANLSCNIAACSQSYRSFRASDCTFQPFEGPRRLCER